MSFWDTQVLPRAVDVVCGLGDLDKLRAPACAELEGDVLEVGFGSGHNVPHYPSQVRSVTAVEPSDVAWHLAEKRIGTSPVDVRRQGLDGQHLDLPDASFDSALSTFTLCTIPDVDAALAEIRRTLKAGGRLHFVEHGLSPDEGVARWQHRLTPVWRPLAGGCHLDRPIVELVERAGFRIGHVEQFYGAGPKAFTYFSLGWASA